MIARKEADKPRKIGPAATIPERRGDIERGYYSVTDKVTYGVRASSPGREKGLFVDHLFNTRVEAEAYARKIAASVSGVKEEVVEGKTPEITIDQARKLIASVRTTYTVKAKGQKPQEVVSVVGGASLPETVFTAVQSPKAHTCPS